MWNQQRALNYERKCGEKGNYYLRLSATSTNNEGIPLIMELMKAYKIKIVINKIK
jgi:hypothetical protein